MTTGAGLLPVPVGMRRLDFTAGTLAENLALDEALLLAAEEEGAPPVLRIWEPTSLAVILGASGRLREDVRLDACLSDGVAVARRPSGGGTVVLGPGIVNVAVVLPIALAPELQAVDTAQVRVLERFAASLRALGPPVRVLGSGDLTLGRLKVAGSAQRRLRRHLLIHATILNAFDLPLVTRYLAEPRRQPGYRENRRHSDFVTNLEMPPADLTAALVEAWRPSGAEMPEAALPWERVRELVALRYSDPSWTSRF